MATKKKQKTVYLKRSKNQRKGPTCIDLFSGAGGLAEGFRQSGWSIVAGNDNDPEAAATFRANFPEASFFEGPIAALHPDDLLEDASLKRGDLDCLLGGPPCQSFSYNNHQRSASDVRAGLFRKYLELVEALLPKTLVMENVPGMLTIGGGAIIKEIEKELGALGYKTLIRILYAEDFGVPQTRRRVFVVASRLGDPADVFQGGSCGPCPKPSEKTNPYVHRWEPIAGAKLKRFTTVAEAIDDLPALRNGGGEDTSRYEKPARSEFQARLRGKRVTLLNHLCHELTETTLERIGHVPQGGNWRDIPRSLLPDGMRRARPSDHTKRYGRLQYRDLASTLLTKCDPHWGAYVHPTQQRTISVREAARLQGFPDRFRFVGEHVTKKYEQVGNAVPPPLAKAIGRAMKRHIASRESSCRVRAKAPKLRMAA